MTYSNKFDTLITSAREGLFYCPNLAQSRLRRLSRFLADNRNAPFLLGVEMPKGIYKHKPHSEETKRKMSISHKGHPKPPKAYKFPKGYIPWNKGKKLPQYSGENSFSWKGGKRIDSKGYIRIYQPSHPFCNCDGYIFEHRLVIEKQIGHYLLPMEHCHHFNGIRDDNRPENLMAFTNKSAHHRFHFNPDNVKPEEIIFRGRKNKHSQKNY